MVAPLFPLTSEVNQEIYIKDHFDERAELLTGYGVKR